MDKWQCSKNGDCKKAFGNVTSACGVFFNEDEELDNVLKIVKARRNVQKIVELCDELNDSQIDTLFMCIAQMKIKRLRRSVKNAKNKSFWIIMQSFKII